MAGAYSFYPTKNLGALGDAGMIVTNNVEVHERSLKYRNYGQSVRYHHPLIGLNSRLDEIQAAILIERDKWLDQFTTRRRSIAGKYNEFLKNSQIELLSKPEFDSMHVYHLYVIKCKSRDKLIEFLKGREIQSYVHYPIPIHLQESCLKTKCDPNGLTHSEKYAAQCLSLPCHPQMTKEEVIRVIDAVNDFS